ncbi:MAG: sodium:proton antiporter [Rhodothermaceae bacterium]|nr:sodium:proton antiporter [Rhodothermaceae bacterium]
MKSFLGAFVYPFYVPVTAVRVAALLLFFFSFLTFFPVDNASAESLDSDPMAYVVNDAPGVIEANAVNPIAADDSPTPPVWLVIPFVLLLIMIATGPLFYAHHWHHHYPKYAVAFGLSVVAYYAFHNDWVPVIHAIQEYSSFIALVASLFIAASGIYLNINANGTPKNNVILLFVGSVIANLIATTGAAMLFIRSYMRLNKGRLRPYHIVFFIFLVANIGGALTPIGDPPLFLGFLRGVPFFWTLTHVWYIWLAAMIVFLAIFYVIDSRNKNTGTIRDDSKPTVQLQGKKSFIWVAIIIVSVFIDPNVLSFVPNLYKEFHIPIGIREIIMLSVAVLAYKFADKDSMEKNEFTFEPIREVGWLFLGIFACMQPALKLIETYATEHADSLTVSVFYWGTGSLSGILDNAPTYLNFLSAAMGKFGLQSDVPAQVQDFAAGASSPESWIFLLAISVAAVFFGALTYIGNAPNFMVKAIAESNGVSTPSFFGYLVRYSIPILIPVFFVIWVIFFSGFIVDVTEAGEMCVTFLGTCNP